MEIVNVINLVIVIVGVPTIVGTLIYIGRKLQILDDLKYIIKEKIEPNLDDTRGRLLVVETELRQVWKAIKQN
jgi:hypothetical protein